MERVYWYPYSGVQLGYRTHDGKNPGKGRKDSGYEVHYPEGGVKIVRTMKEARAYIDNYLN